MQFREHNNVVPVVLYDAAPEKLAMKVAALGKEFKIIDLQYSSHAVAVEKSVHEVFSVFVLAQISEEQMKKAVEDAKAAAAKVENK